MEPTVDYSERLTVPLRWWVQGTMFSASIWLACAVAMAPLAAGLIALAFGALIAFGFLSYGAARISVAGSEFRAGRARIPVSFVGDVTALDAEQTRLIAGRDADARAYLLLRPFLKRAVKVTIDDPRDPTPYWLVSTRHPQRLARALATSPGHGVDAAG